GVGEYAADPVPPERERGVQIRVRDEADYALAKQGAAHATVPVQLLEEPVRALEATASNVHQQRVDRPATHERERSVDILQPDHAPPRRETAGCARVVHRAVLGDPRAGEAMKLELREPRAKVDDRVQALLRNFRSPWVAHGRPSSTVEGPRSRPHLT